VVLVALGRLKRKRHKQAMAGALEEPNPSPVKEKTT